MPEQRQEHLLELELSVELRFEFAEAMGALGAWLGLELEPEPLARTVLLSRAQASKHSSIQQPEEHALLSELKWQQELRLRLALEESALPVRIEP